MIKLSFLGDIMLGRGVQDSFIEYGAEHIVSGLKNLSLTDRVVVANLEAPFSENKVSYQGKESKLSFAIDEDMIDVINALEINCVSLANNHMTDCGHEGIATTKKVLEDNGITYCGAGDNKDEAYKLLTIAEGSIKVGMLSVCAFNQYVKFATKNKWGIAAFNKKEIIKRLLDHKDYDIMILSIHWGIDYHEFPVQRYIEHVKDIIDKVPKLKLVIGHHPHLIQPIIRHRESIIACSLGNFLFDEPFPLSRIGMVLDVDIDHSKKLSIDANYIALTQDNRLKPADEWQNEAKRINNVMELMLSLDKRYLEMNQLTAVRDLFHIFQDFSWAKVNMYLSLFYIHEIIFYIAIRTFNKLKGRLKK